ncbi:glycosyltransferase [Paenibacillus rubinfantis]|uniref:glycosyltransferase n=1 Tax=Paenibacillus rubinfantis TaxID=1720296 RepID=UPI00073EBED0|nr:glycosyltransferase [Paenibacillus rubinfantis]
MKKTSIILAGFDEEIEYLKDSIDSIRRYTEKGLYELIVVSSFGSMKVSSWLSEQTDLRPLFIDNEDLTLTQAWNQGAQFALGDFILFMHADNIVTENWLVKLRDAIENNDGIGAVGPLTNYATNNYPTEEVKFSSINDLLSYSNQIDGAELEKVLVLSDFMVFMKRTVFEEVGFFDEQFSGSSLIVDYSMRLSKAGWSIAVSKNTFIYHYGYNEPSQKKIFMENFKKKWGFDIDYTSPLDRVIRYIHREKDDIFSVLIIGSGIGATNLELLKRFPHADVYGCNIEDGVPHIFSYNVFEILLNDCARKFDYIILNPKLELDKILNKAFNLLDDSGKLLIEMPNLNYFENVRSLLCGSGFQTDKRFWNLTDIVSLFEKEGFAELDVDYVTKQLIDEDTYFIKEVEALVDELPYEFEVESFVITAQKNSRNYILHGYFKELLTKPQERLLSSIYSHSTEQILASLDSYEGGGRINIMNYLGIYYLEKKQYDSALAFFNKAYEYDPEEAITITNIATYLYTIGEEQDALCWLNKLEDKSDQILKWMSEIELGIYKNKYEENQLKFLLRRIENDVEKSEACNSILQLIELGKISIDQIVNNVNLYVFDKVGVFNQISAMCFDSELYDWVLPFLEHAYDKDSNNPNTLYNLGMVLYSFNEYNLALNFLYQINGIDEDIELLKRKIKEKIQ